MWIIFFSYLHLIIMNVEHTNETHTNLDKPHSRSKRQILSNVLGAIFPYYWQSLRGNNRGIVVSYLPSISEHTVCLIPTMSSTHLDNLRYCDLFLTTVSFSVIKNWSCKYLKFQIKYFFIFIFLTEEMRRYFWGHRPY